jgi:hypothetical protein
MANFIYNEDGDAVGFWDDAFIFTLDGRPVGQLNGPSVHKLDGSYIGELYEDMIVDRFSQDLGGIEPANTPARGPVPMPANRGMMSYGFPDVFDLLLK